MNFNNMKFKPHQEYSNFEKPSISNYQFLEQYAI